MSSRLLVVNQHQNWRGSLCFYRAHFLIDDFRNYIPIRRLLQSVGFILINNQKSRNKEWSIIEVPEYCPKRLYWWQGLWQGLGKKANVRAMLLKIFCHCLSIYRGEKLLFSVVFQACIICLGLCAFQWCYEKKMHRVQILSRNPFREKCFRSLFE